MNKYYPPKFDEEQFHCPFCRVYAKQYWSSAYAGSTFVNGYNFSKCSHCNNSAIWVKKELNYPNQTIAPPPHEDMPPELLDDYLEATAIINKSPRGAAALIRLALQKLMVVLGESGKDINKDIGSLVQKGLHPNVQQALDIVRVIGNESVHPGTLDLKDDIETALQLFGLINFIVEDRITRPKTIQDLINTLPEGKLKGIENRDKVKTP